MGGLTPLKQVASFEKAPGVSIIKHLDRKRVVTVSANIDESVTTSQRVNQILSEKFADMPQQNPGYTFHYGGEAEDTQESIDSLNRAALIACLLIFLILLITFGSFTQTLVLMWSIPFGAVGIILGFAILNEPFSFLALLGVVGLTGVVVDGGTLFFSFVNHLKNTNLSLKEKIQQASETRFRPIILTTATTVLGVIPAAYGIGGNDPFIRPMALAMNWGLFGSMFFTLYTIPCLYYLAEEKLSQLRLRLKF
jgi:multidrug efflux pump subunit AcrB